MVEASVLRDKAVIVGIGETQVGKLPGRSRMSLEIEACRLALEDAGIGKDQVDGFLTRTPNDRPVYDYCTVLAHRMGLSPTFMSDVGTMGCSPITMAIIAAMAVTLGQAEVVLCTTAHNAASHEGPKRGSAGGDAADYTSPYGHLGAPAGYAMAARRHMYEYGTTSRQFGAIAVAARKHASMNPNAQMKQPITIEDHQNSRWITDPFHLLDCCLQSDGAGAFVVTSAERAKDLKTRPAFIMGVGQHYPYGELNAAPSMTTVGSKRSSELAYKMAGIGPKDVDVAEIYDCFTYTTLVTLEDYGFCKKGEGGSFVEGGRIEIGGELPVNTHGGLLSQGHVEAMLHLLEGVRQARHDPSLGPRQVENAEIAMVSGNGGILQMHNSLILRG